MVKIVELPYCFYPDAVGGTEVYVEALARNLCALGVDAMVAAPGDPAQSGKHRGLHTRRFALGGGQPDLREMYGAGDPVAADGFDRILQEEAPDLVHLHAFTSGVSLRLLRKAKARGLPVVFTYHTPTVSCLRGTLLRFGEEVCDGVMDASLCAACHVQGLGVPKAAARAIGTLPVSISTLPGKMGWRGRIATAWRARELAVLRHATTRTLWQEADHIVAVCDWVKDVLLRNGVPADKVTVSRQGLCYASDGVLDSAARLPSQVRKPLKIAFLGRLHPTKGIDVLLRALRIAPDSDLQLDIYGVAQGREGDVYGAKLKEIAGNDARIRFLAPVRADKVVSTLASYDLLAVPSQWLESGPMVVLEAFAAGVPVIGSRLGGLQEIVRDGVDGVLVEAKDPTAWAAKLRELVAAPGRLDSLRAGIKSPRQMDEAAREMRGLYSRLLAERKTRATTSVASGAVRSLA